MCFAPLLSEIIAFLLSKVAQRYGTRTSCESPGKLFAGCRAFSCLQ